MINKTDIYCIYRDGEEYPYAIIGYEPLNTDVNFGDRVCKIACETYKPYSNQRTPTMPSNAESVRFDEDKEVFPAGSLFYVYEVNKDGSSQRLGSDQGYAHKKAKSIVKNLLIAYPNNEYKIKRKV